MFEDEFTSCDTWAEIQRDKQRLLECFVHAATQAPLTIRAKQKKNRSVAGQAQIDRRKELSNSLNNLVREYFSYHSKSFVLIIFASIIVAHLNGESRGRGDAHPKTSNPHIKLQANVFRGGVRLEVQMAPDSRIDADILKKGAKAGALKDSEVQKWLADIHDGRYRVVRSNIPLSSTSDDQAQASSG